MLNKKRHNYFLPNIKFSFSQLLVLTIISVLVLLIVICSTSFEQRTEYSEMKIASQKMAEAGKILREFRKNNALEIDRNFDPFQTGFIGTEFSPITTTLGDLEAKKISTNPDFAALFLLWFKQLELKQSDTILIHLSGSFPALGVAAIIASETYGLQPIIFSSIGSSSFGANNPELTYWDIEHFFYEEKIIHHKTSYASLGGQNDNGSSFWEGGKEIGIASSKTNNLKLYIFETIDETIQKKYEVMNKVRFALFINIGGNQSAVGNTTTNIFSDKGLIANKELQNFDSNSLLSLVNKRQIPIIHMLNIKDIALENGIDLISNEYYSAGNSDLYFIRSKSRSMIIIALAIIFFAMIIIKRNLSK